MSEPEFRCTCEDTSCPFHPSNHGKGCTPCIEKNLRLGEIPSCFFRKAGLPRFMDSYTIEAFAHAVIELKEKNS